MARPSLSPQDTQAIDLLLDHGASAGTGTTGFAAVAVDQERLSAATKVLRTLDAMKADEPSADLAHRTLRKIDSVIRPAAVHGLGNIAGTGQQTHA